MHFSIDLMSTFLVEQQGFNPGAYSGFQPGGQEDYCPPPEYVTGLIKITLILHLAYNSEFQKKDWYLAPCSKFLIPVTNYKLGTSS